MPDDLSLKAKGMLASQYNKLMLDEKAMAKASGILNEVLNWCEDLEITPGKWVKPQQSYKFHKEYIQQINQILVAAEYASIFDDFRHDTHQTAAQRNPNEKQGLIKPTHHLVLVALTNKNVLNALQERFYPSQQLNVELDVNQIPLKVFDYLVVVENRDSFNDWCEFKPYSPLENALVIYRGDKYHSTACKKLVKNWQRSQGNKPCVYFGDFDLAGLRIATSAGYSHLLLPEYPCLQAQVIQQHYPDNQQKYLAKLKQDCPKNWQSLLTLMVGARAGLRQQKMLHTNLILYPNTHPSAVPTQCI